MKITHSLALSLALLVIPVSSMTFAPVASASEPPYAKLLEKGERSLKKKDYENAVATFTKVLKDHPGVYEAYLSRAAARSELKDNDGALADYEQAIKANPNAVEIYLQRGELLARLGDKDAAVRDYGEVLKLDPKDTKALLLRAQALKENGDFAGAAKDYDQYLKFNSSSLSARRERSECKLQLNAYNDAIADYEYILKKGGSKEFDVHYQWGEALKLKGDTKGATDQFNQAITYYSKNLTRSQKKGLDYIYRGMAYYQLSQLEKALSDLDNGVRLVPGNAIAQSRLGHVLLAKGDSTAALGHLDEALKINPRLQSALVDRATIKAAQGSYEDSKADLDKALQITRNADGLYSRAMTLLSLGDVGAAADDLSEANKLNPALMESKRKDLAAKIEKGPAGPAGSGAEAGSNLDQALNYSRLALFDLAVGDLSSAERLVRQSIKLDQGKRAGGGASSLLLLGHIYLKKHSLVEAEAMFRTALNKLSQSGDGNQKYAVFSLEQCAKQFMLGSKLEEAGSIFSDTRMLRAAHGWTEHAMPMEVSKRAEQAVEAYKQKRKYDRQEDLVRKAASGSSSDSSSASASGGSSSNEAVDNSQVEINRPIRDKWALIIGTGRFKDPKINLRYAAKDAQDFSDFLIKERNFAPDHVQLLTNEAATRANILSLLGSKWLPRVAEKDDLVVIYFSTHGSPSSLDLGGVNYLVAHDTDPSDLYATGIAMQDLARIIKARVHSDRVMLVLDACHSGVTAPASGKSIVRPGNVDVDPIVQGTGQLVISSSKPDQRSWESQRYEGSVFTRYLIDGFRKNGNLTKLGDAYSYMESEVQREVLRDRGLLQTPVMRSKWRGSDLILGVKPAAPSPGLGPIELPDAVDTQVKVGATGSGKAVGRSKTAPNSGNERRQRGANRK
ncbi:MAG: tetratricopeptide repeat protein [Candidatus Obscuribacterales bacterium]